MPVYGQVPSREFTRASLAMPLAHLLTALEREATAQAEALLAAARDEAAETARGTDARLARRRSDALGPRETELRRAAAAALGAARRCSKRENGCSSACSPPRVPGSPKRSRAMHTARRSPSTWPRGCAPSAMSPP